MEISDLDIVMFNTKDYFKRPFIRVIYENNLKELNGAKIHIYDRETIAKEIAPHLKQVKWALDTDFNDSFLGDAARCYLATKYKNYLYLDADTFITRRYVEKMMSSDKNLLLPGAFDNTFSTSILFCRNYGHPILQDICDAYENVTNTEDYKLYDWVFIKNKIPLDKRQKTIKDAWFIPNDCWSDLLHIGYGKFTYFYDNIFAKNATFAYTTKNIELDNPLVKKYGAIWMINNNTPYQYMRTSDKGEIIFQLPTGNFSIEKMIFYFLLDIDYHARLLGVKPKIIDVTNEY